MHAQYKSNQQFQLWSSPILQLKMIFQFAIVTLAVAALPTANPLAVYSRQLTNFQQCGNLPTRCLNAYRDYIQAISSSSSSHQHPSDRVAHATQAWLDAQCSSECLGPYLRCAGITERVRNLTLQISCARAEDGNFCLPKVIREVARGLSIIPPSTCTTTCSKFTQCQSFHRQLQNGLGCCVATLFTNRLSPYYPLQQVRRSFTACNAPIGNPCAPATAAGAAIIYLNVMIPVLAAVFLVFFAIMWPELKMVCSLANI